MRDIDEVLERIVTDVAFRDELRTDPTAALAGYRLSEADLRLLAATIDDDAGAHRGVEQRTSKSALLGMLASLAPEPDLVGAPQAPADELTADTPPQAADIGYIKFGGVDGESDGALPPSHVEDVTLKRGHMGDGAGTPADDLTADRSEQPAGYTFNDLELKRGQTGDGAEADALAADTGASAADDGMPRPNSHFTLKIGGKESIGTFGEDVVEDFFSVDDADATEAPDTEAPPYELPESKPRSGLRSRSSLAGSFESVPPPADDA